MTLTKEQIRARYFACHLGVKCKWVGFYGARNGNVDGDTLTGNCGNKTFQLLLNPLSAITDEHALEVFKMVHDGQEIESYEPQDNIKYMVETVREHILCEKFQLSSHIIAALDISRSLGYHTGKFMGYCPIAEGWCLLNDKNVKL